MAKTKIILASTLSVLAVGGVTTAAVVVTIKNKEKENKENKKTQSLTKIQNIAKPINNPKTDNQTNSETSRKDDFKEINEAIKNEYDKETQIISEYDQGVAKYWEEQEINKTIKSHYDEETDKINEYDKKVAEYYKDKEPNSVEKPNNQPQSDDPSTNGSASDGKVNSGLETQPTKGKENQPNTDAPQKPAHENNKKPTLKVVNSSWEGYEQGNVNKQGYVTFTLWSTNEKYDQIVKAGSKLKLLLWFDKFDNQEDGAMPITLKTNQGDKTVYTLNPISKDGGKQFEIQTISPFTLNTWDNTQKEVKIKLIGLFINDDKNNNLIDGPQGEPVIIK